MHSKKCCLLISGKYMKFNANILWNIIIKNVTTTCFIGPSIHINTLFITAARPNHISQI